MKLFNEFTNLYTDTSVSTSIQTMLDNHFKYREVCDDDNFEFFWKRNINRYYDKFVKLQLTELVTDFDTDFKTEIENLITRTDDLKTTHGGNDTTNITKGTGSTTTYINANVQKELELNAPQSIQYSTSQNSENNLDWTYVSRQSETSNKNSDFTISNNGKDVNDISYNSNITNTGTQKNENKGLTKGYNTSQTTRYKDAYNFISNSDSFMWFVSKLEICFLGIYENE